MSSWEKSHFACFSHVSVSRQMMQQNGIMIAGGICIGYSENSVIYGWLFNRCCSSYAKVKHRKTQIPKLSIFPANKTPFNHNKTIIHSQNCQQFVLICHTKRTGDMCMKFDIPYIFGWKSQHTNCVANCFCHFIYPHKNTFPNKKISLYFKW